MAAKYQQLAEILRSELTALSTPGGKLPTETELSLRYHMSRQTIRHALQQLRQEGMIESRQGSGSYLVTHPRHAASGEVAVITTYADDYIFPKITHELQDYFSRNSLSANFYATGNRLHRERDVLTHLLEVQPRALLVEGCRTALPSPNADLFEQLRSQGIPIVFFHGVPENLQRFPHILDNNAAGGFTAASYLRSRGHRAIGGLFFCDDLQGPQRCQGFLRALQEDPMAEDRVFWLDTSIRDGIVDGQDDGFFTYLAPRLEQLTALVCYNDEIAHFLIRYLVDHGRRVPEDLAVVGFDDSYYSQIGPVPITTLRHPGSGPWLVAAQTLVGILGGGAEENATIDWKIVVRKSG